MEPIQLFYDNISPEFMNILKFILIQDPVKIAIGMALGLSISKIFTEIIGDLIKPLIHVFLNIFSKTGFNYIFYGSAFNIGAVIEQLIIFVIFIVLLYYVFVLPINKLKVKYNIEQKTVTCPYCTTLINPLAIKCPACTSELEKN